MLRGLKAKGCQTDGEAGDEGGCQEQLDLHLRIVLSQCQFLPEYFNEEQLKNLKNLYVSQQKKFVVDIWKPKWHEAMSSL